MTGESGKKDQRTKHLCGLCGYCMKNMAHRMAMVKGGTNARYRRWMCEQCIQFRQAKGARLLLSKGGEDGAKESACNALTGS